MLGRLFVFALGILFLSGCATVSKKHALELQECLGRVSLLEGQVADLKYELRTKGAESRWKSGYDRKTNTGSGYTASQSATRIQKALKNAGYYNGPVDGKIGARTQEAIMKFQKDNGLKADGQVGQMTWSELKSYLE